MARTVQYLGGSPARVAPRRVAQEWLRVTRTIPPQFAVGSAFHESGYAINELDTEPNGHATGGVFQLDVPTLAPLNPGDAIAAGMPDKDPFDLADACAIFAATSERRLRRILDAVDMWNDDHGWPALDHTNPPPDVWAYLGLAHNQGLGACLKTIAAFGLDWDDYKRRNPTVDFARPKTGGRIYGDSCKDGGPDWSADFANPFETDEAGEVLTDANGLPIVIGAPVVSAAASSLLRIGLLGLLALLLLYLATGRQPMKVVIA